MKRLSSPIENISQEYNVIVIGSGYGGSITASRMARAGKKVCLLERGKEFQPGEYPNTFLKATEEMQTDAPDLHTGKKSGLYDLHVNHDINVFKGCGLGGTSLINANVGMEPEPRVFTDKKWPKEIQHDNIKMAEAFARVNEMLKTKPMPQSFSLQAKTKALQKAAEKMGLGNKWKRTPIYVNFDVKGANHVGVNQNPCNGCGDCCSGCNYASKNTMIMNYLPDAKNHGAEIYTQVNVRFIEKKNNRWCVHYNLLQTGEEKFDAPTEFVFADVVVLSAGSLGSTEILFRSKQNGLKCSDMLGERFTGNGDFLAFGYNNDVHANSIGCGTRPASKTDPVGPTITSVIDLRKQANLNEGMVIEEGAAPGLMAHAFKLMITTAATLTGEPTEKGWIGKLKAIVRKCKSFFSPYYGAMNNTMVYLVMTFDDDHGKMFLKDDRLRINWPNLGRQRIFQKVNKRLREVTKALGGTYTVDPLWTDTFHKQLVTVHPLGGCIMAENAKEGVVNHKGQVFIGNNTDEAYEGLYVSDGAIVPCALGVNPSLTISALAERNCVYMAADRKWTFNYDFPTVDPSPDTESKPGIEFTEKMKGFIEKCNSGTDFENSFEIGKSKNQECEFVLTIVSEDVEQMLNDSIHEAKIKGTLTAPLISPEPMNVTGGIFNLFVIDPDSANTRLMKYGFPFETEEGEKYFFYGFKRVHDDPGFDMWSDTSTLFITLYSGTDTTGEVIAKGILKISPTDLGTQLSTMKAINVSSLGEKLKWEAKFGKYFAGVLAEIYGGVLNPAEHFNPEATLRTQRKLRVSNPEIYPLKIDGGVMIRLTRYNGGRKPPVMLAHGLGVNSKIFSIDTIETNLLEFLFENGYDVWVLDFRASIDLPSSQTQFTADEIAKYDHPAAVKKILDVTGVKEIDVIGHCYGATTLSMALLNGIKGIRSCVFSQIGPHVISPSFTQAKSGLHLPEFLEAVGVNSMNSYTDSHAHWKDKLFNKLLELYPNDSANKTHDAVSNRITFTYGQLYELNNLNRATFESLHEMFGIANIDALKHLAAMVRAKSVVNAAGKNDYLPYLGERMNLPVTFIHGAMNKCFLPISTETTYTELKRLNPSQRYNRHVIPGYGHIDCIFGKNAAQDVYPFILKHLEKFPN